MPHRKQMTTAFLRNDFIYRSKHLSVELICETTVKWLWSVRIEPGTQSLNFLGHIFGTDREFFPFRSILGDNPDVAILI